MASPRGGTDSTERDRYLTEDWTDMDFDSHRRLPAGTTTLVRRVAVVGAGRLGAALAAERPTGSGGGVVQNVHMVDAFRQTPSGSEGAHVEVPA